MLVAGVDFGTLSVRVALVEGGGAGVPAGVVGAAVEAIPLRRSRDEPDLATQSHADHLAALERATRAALRQAGVAGKAVAAIALDTTGSSVIPVDAAMQPLGEYYLWCDHRAKGEAAEITARARAVGLPALDWCGGVYSAEWGWAKLLHWVRHNPNLRPQCASAFEHCDFIAATLAGVRLPAEARRSACAMGHKWMWNAQLGGLPPEDFWAGVDPLLGGMRARLGPEPATSDALAGHLCPAWAERLGLRAGIPIPVGAFDAHWDAIGAGAMLDDMVNVIGTSTCMIGIAREPALIPGVCGVVRGSVHPRYSGVEAGLSATGDIFDAIARRAGVTVQALSQGLERYRAGQTGLLRLSWDNGDRTVLVNHNLGGVTLGWRLHHTAQDELFAAIEGTALHTRLILERMADRGAAFQRVIHAGGIPQQNPVLNQVYANVLGRPVLVPQRPITSLGAGIFAHLAAGTFTTLEDAQQALCPPHQVFTPEPAAQAVYDQIYPLYRQLYFALGQADAGLGRALPELIRLAGGLES
ncbi:MAG: ribulokinase [Terriglobales bacterium]